MPSVWEQQGFGAYDYGHNEDKHDELGFYRRTLEIPPEWAGRRIELVFDGVMTDASVRVDGHRVGPIHRGGFYRFRRDITDLVEPGGRHELEVAVAKISSDRSVELAERDADYWVFGGIFRPVRLVAHPSTSIDHLAFDARHHGSLHLRARVVDRGASTLEDARLRLWVETLDGEAVDGPFEAEASGSTFEISTQVDGVEAWSADTPRLYRARVELVRDGQVLHQVDEVIGFRTIELRPGGDDEVAGLFVNDRRVLLRGVNRHAFWPTTGRAVDPEVDWRDAAMLKAMHVNAVRASHYPPNDAFLDAADRLGLYVIDELAGWHDAYDTEVGAELVREMVERDVNRPSVILWANGNEGGWNPDLDDVFHAHDPQRRPVFWPHEVRNGLDAYHYPTLEELRSRLEPTSWRSRRRAVFDRLGGGAGQPPLVLPTEFLHALYDGGGGAGLGDYWRQIQSSSLALGGFLWAFVDEAIVRTDGSEPRFDTDGNHAPDGIVGPFREPSPSVAALRELWAPVEIQIHKEITLNNRVTRLDNPRIELRNGFDHLDLARCHLRWRLLAIPTLAAIDSASRLEVIVEGSSAIRSTPPGEVTFIELDPPLDPSRPGLFEVEVVDASGRVVGRSQSWRPTAPAAELGPLPSSLPASAHARGSAVTQRAEEGSVILESESLATGGVQLSIELQDQVVRIESATASFDFGALRPALDERAPRVRRIEKDESSSGAVGFRMHHDGLPLLVWRLWPSGWVELSWLADDGEAMPPGLLLPWIDASKTPAAQASRREHGLAAGLRWWGLGPWRVWGNRMHGRWGLWQVGRAQERAPRWGHGPSVDGYRVAGLARVDTADGALLVVPSDGLVLAVGQPRFPGDAEEAVAAKPALDGLGVWAAAPSIGTKFYPPEDLGATAPPPLPRRGSLWLRPAPPAPSDDPSPTESP